jgi:hypothetical protein
MIQIEEEFILNTLRHAYEKYNFYKDKDKEKTLKIYGFCDSLEKLIYKFSPGYADQVKSLREEYGITKEKIDSDVDLEVPTWLRNQH